jgi:release factor glutamine methyltransferase
MQKPKALKGPEWTILTVLKWTASYFATHDIENPRSDAEILLAHVLDSERVDLYLRYDQPLTDSELARYKALIKRRVSREPVAYIVGHKGFWEIELTVGPDVLIPRPETECLVEASLAILETESNGDTLRILELGTGSGAIILTLAKQHPRHVYFASDRSVNALKVAAENAVSAGIGNKVKFFCADWLSPLGDRSGPMDMIVSNPPYIPRDDLKGLMPEIYCFEPRLALDGGNDGLSCLVQIITAAYLFLKPGGQLILEIGHDQRKAIARIIEQTGRYRNIRFLKDYGGHDRVVSMETAPNQDL